jgi:hypothetical protein
LILLKCRLNQEGGENLIEEPDEWDEETESDDEEEWDEETE